MANGRLSALDITVTNTDTVIYTVPSGKLASFSLNICNRNSANVKVRLAFTETSTVLPSEYIEYDAVIQPNETLQRLGVLLSSGQIVQLSSDTTDVNIVIWGLEE